MLHGKMRKYLSNAFSQRSLLEQEFLIAKSIDKFIRKLGKVGAQGTDIVLNFTLVSFDVIGDLGFGETFGGIESGTILSLKQIRASILIHIQRNSILGSNG